MEEGCPAGFVSGCGESDEIESPTLGPCITFTPDIENKERAQQFTGARTGKERMEVVGIELGRSIQPRFRSPHKTGKATNEGKNLKIRRGFTFSGKMAVHGFGTQGQIWTARPSGELMGLAAFWAPWRMRK